MQIIEKTYKADLFDNKARLEEVKLLSQQHRFFHIQLEFVEVFKDRGGFDLIVGNPPWLKVTFEEKGIMSEVSPELDIRKISASKVRELQTDFLENGIRKDAYFTEYISAESSAGYMNSIQNFPLKKGQSQASNLYKCILENAFKTTAKNGFIGLVHPESIYDDPKGQILREEVFKRLVYHFQFKNELSLFSEVHHETIFGINIYRGVKDIVSFISINNLFHPTTIEGSFVHSGTGLPDGFKVKDENSGKMIWNIKPHQDRIINIDSKNLKILAKTFENSDQWNSTKLVSIHSKQIIRILEKLSLFKGKLENFDFYLTDGWRETDAINSGYIKRESKETEIDKYDLIIGGPNFFVSNPLYKTPYKKCKLNSDYDCIDLNAIDGRYVQRTIFQPNCELLKFKKKFEWTVKGKSKFWLEEYKLGFSKMLSIAGERTLQPAIVAPKVSHNSGVISVLLEDQKNLIELTGICSSLILDFYIKTLGRGNLYESSIKTLLLGISNVYKPVLNFRTLSLNCLNEYYSQLWSENWSDKFQNEYWSKKDNRLKQINKGY